MPAPGPWSGNPFLSTTVAAESEGNNSAVGDKGTAKGDWQFHDATWQKYAKNVPGASQYASAADAPPEVQTAVAETAPISEWGPRTKEILHAKFGAFDESQTHRPTRDRVRRAGQGGGGSRLARSIGRHGLRQSGSAVDPAGQRGGRIDNPASGWRRLDPEGRRWWRACRGRAAAMGAEWTGVGRHQRRVAGWSGRRSSSSRTRARPAQAPAAPGQASVASLVSGMVSDPQMARPRLRATLLGP